MAPNYTVSRNDLISWVNSTVDLSLTKIEQLSTGAVLTQVIDAYYPGSVQMKKLNFAAHSEYENTLNYKVMQAAFKKLEINKDIDVLQLSKGSAVDTLEFLQWLYTHMMTAKPRGPAQGYNAEDRRADSKGGRTLKAEVGKLGAPPRGTTPPPAREQRPGSARTRAASKDKDKDLLSPIASAPKKRIDDNDAGSDGGGRVAHYTHSPVRPASAQRAPVRDVPSAAPATLTPSKRAGGAAGGAPAGAVGGGGAVVAVETAEHAVSVLLRSLPDLDRLSRVIGQEVHDSYQHRGKLRGRRNCMHTLLRQTEVLLRDVRDLSLGEGTMDGRKRARRVETLQGEVAGIGNLFSELCDQIDRVERTHPVPEGNAGGPATAVDPASRSVLDKKLLDKTLLEVGEAHARLLGGDGLLGGGGHSGHHHHLMGSSNESMGRATPQGIQQQSSRGGGGGGGKPGGSRAAPAPSSSRPGGARAGELAGAGSGQAPRTPPRGGGGRPGSAAAAGLRDAAADPSGDGSAPGGGAAGSVPQGERSRSATPPPNRDPGRGGEEHGGHRAAPAGGAAAAAVYHHHHHHHANGSAAASNGSAGGGRAATNATVAAGAQQQQQGVGGQNLSPHTGAGAAASTGGAGGGAHHHHDDDEPGGAASASAAGGQEPPGPHPPASSSSYYARSDSGRSFGQSETPRSPDKGHAPQVPQRQSRQDVSYEIRPPKPHSPAGVEVGAEEARGPAVRDRSSSVARALDGGNQQQQQQQKGGGAGATGAGGRTGGSAGGGMDASSSAAAGADGSDGAAGAAGDGGVGGDGPNTVVVERKTGRKKVVEDPNLRNGLYRSVCSNGDWFEGCFVNSKKDGEGMYCFANGDKYEGEFQDDAIQGSGVYSFVTKGRYEGDWDRAQYHGHGMETWAMGTTYIGTYVEGIRLGFGVSRYFNGDYYEGEWRDGRRDGRGMQQCTDDSNYVGDYSRGKRHGWGVYSFHNGDTYSGEYSSDMTHGHGVYAFVNGQLYEGEWYRGKKHGRCIYTIEDGKKWAGIWENGELKGARELSELSAEGPGGEYDLYVKAAQNARAAASIAAGKAELHWQQGGEVQVQLREAVEHAEEAAKKAQDWAQRMRNIFSGRPPPNQQAKPPA